MSEVGLELEVEVLNLEAGDEWSIVFNEAIPGVAIVRQFDDRITVVVSEHLLGSDGDVAAMLRDVADLLDPQEGDDDE